MHKVVHGQVTLNRVEYVFMEQQEHFVMDAKIKIGLVSII
jgi:hypothetical protein